MMSEAEVRKLLAAQKKIVRESERRSPNCRCSECVGNFVAMVVYQLVLGEHPKQDRQVENVLGLAATLPD
jgi:hypothetical protein